MISLPISLCFFTSTRGHFGHKDVYKATLTHYDRQLPMSLFAQKVAHVKVTPGEEAIAADMVADLAARGFEVIQTNGEWTRGLSHGAAYLSDQVKLSKHPSVYTQPYLFFVEDDSPTICHGTTLEDLLLKSCSMLCQDHEMLTARVMRRGDDKGPISSLSDDTRFFWSEHVNYQPLVMRTLDFYRLGILLEANPSLCGTVQCEMLWRLILDQFSRSPRKHLVWEVDHAETVHLGLPTYPSLKSYLNL